LSKFRKNFPTIPKVQRLNVDKSTFLKKKLKILGHIISEHGIESDPVKIQDILNIPQPTNKQELLHFLGCIGYFRRFIKKFSSIARPLTTLTQKLSTFTWGDEQQHAFTILKSILTNPPLLRFFDPLKPIHIYTDASGSGLGCALLQPDHIGLEFPVAYAS